MLSHDPVAWKATILMPCFYLDLMRVTRPAGELGTAVFYEETKYDGITTCYPATPLPPMSTAVLADESLTSASAPEIFPPSSILRTMPWGIAVCLIHAAWPLLGDLNPRLWREMRRGSFMALKGDSYSCVNIFMFNEKTPVFHQFKQRGTWIKNSP